MTAADPQPAVRVFYDGNCGMCHGTVRQFMRHTAGAHGFRFAPLHGDTFNEHVPAAQRDALPDSLLVLTPDGQLLTRTDAVIFLLRHMTGLYRAVAGMLRIIPRPLRDLGYRMVARTRHVFFSRPKEACPMPPGEFRKAFDP
jgi:predicted DCC family thiol-disulfide oxidoreductase YuxK